MTDLADRACAYLLKRIQSDARLAYYFGFTEALKLLGSAYAERHNLDAEKFVAALNRTLKCEPPTCRKCGDGLHE